MAPFGVHNRQSSELSVVSKLLPRGVPIESSVLFCNQVVGSSDD